MRVAIFITILLLAYCLSADAGWFRRRRRGSRTVRVGVRYNNGVPAGTATWTHKSGNFEGSITGSVGGDGGWSAGASGSWSWKKKRSVESSGFNVTLQVDQCSFQAYDDDRNGEITVDEFLDIFGNSEKASVLFDSLETDPANDLITMEEFLENAPKYIIGCAEEE